MDILFCWFHNLFSDIHELPLQYHKYYYWIEIKTLYTQSRTSQYRLLHQLFFSPNQQSQFSTLQP